MSSLEYDLLTFEAHYYLNKASSTREEVRELMAKADEYVRLARETHERARELASMDKQQGEKEVVG